ncbi:MAG TPA: hypothetical protein VK982_07570 [Bacteroidales bacterium]|nr:hypothetical protein [Bacteroidales bacterium]
MGHDIVGIGKHNLNTNSNEELALDLSKRFKVNVEYGYQDNDKFDIKTGESISTYRLVKLGRIDYPKAKTTVVLMDEYYQLHQYYNQYGNDVYQLHGIEKNEFLKEMIEHSLGKIYYQFFDPVDENYYCTIYNNTQECGTLYFGRWWELCWQFTDKNNDEEIKRFNEYRKSLMEFQKIVGGNDVVYLDDQGATEYLTFGDYLWEGILNELKTKFNKTTLNISEFISKEKFTPLKDYPLAFYDDFKDLKNE